MTQGKNLGKHLGVGDGRGGIGGVTEDKGKSREQYVSPKTSERNLDSSWVTLIEL